MKKHLLSLLFIAELLLVMACNRGPEASIEKTAPSIKGVWTIEEMDTGTGDNKKTVVPQAFMLFMMEKHYSAIRDFSQEPRKAWGGQTGEGGGSGSVSGFMADAGTYEYNGNELVVHHQVSMIPNMMGGGSSMTFGCQLEGDNTLILTPQYDKMAVPGMNLAPSPDGKMAYGDMAVRYKFKRLE